MTTEEKAVIPVIAQDLTVSDLRQALAAGWSDFRAHPFFGLLFSGVYAFVGLGLFLGVSTWGGLAWYIPAIAGFPIVAPFIGVGLYEVSRRRELGLPMRWAPILKAIRGHGDDQIALMGGLVFVAFSFWVILAHTISLVFLPDIGATTNPLGAFVTGPGIAMLAVGSAVGGLMAWVLFSLTIISLPMLVDRDVDCITAMIASVKAVRSNLAIMLIWAMFVAMALVAGMALLFLGLLVVLPVLGHATWHLYRRAVQQVVA